MNKIQRLQEHTVKIYQITEEDITEEKICASNLLTINRFDLFAKLFYIKYKSTNPLDAIRIYDEHIKAFNPDLKEPGRDDKNSLEDFRTTFDELILQFEKNDFDCNHSLIPICSDNTILDGAHRVTALAYNGRNAGVARIKRVTPKAQFDYKYFKDRGLSWDTMDQIALEMADWIPNLHVACLWPKNSNKYEAIKCLNKHFTFAYEKTLKTNLNSFKKLIAKVYESQPWVKEPESVADKSLNCYGFNGEIIFIFFTANSLAEVLKVKDEIRDIYGDGKHSIHITDTAEETKNIAKFILDKEILKSWNNQSTADTLKTKLNERWYYFKKVQLINIKMAIAKLIGYKS